MARRPDPDDIGISIAFGYSFTGAELEAIFGTGMHISPYLRYRGKSYDAPEELLEVWCQEHGWCFMGHADYNHCSPQEVVYHISPHALMSTDTPTLEELMRMEEAACDIGFKLRELGFEVEGPPRVTYSAAIYR
jgi:hypothetical protein